MLSVRDILLSAPFPPGLQVLVQLSSMELKIGPGSWCSSNEIYREQGRVGILCAPVSWIQCNLGNFRPDPTSIEMAVSHLSWYSEAITRY